MVEQAQASLKLRHPTVYLDQWVWIRLAKANIGKPLQRDDLRVLEAVRGAAERGFRFPLSSTHYEETTRVGSAEQRRELARVMAPISQMQTFRSHSSLLRHQFLVALHETVGRPTFRPTQPQVIGIGVHWAFAGVQAFFKVLDPTGRVIQSVDGAWLRHLNQYGEAAVLAGPMPEELPSLIELGYVMPQELEKREGSRVDYEEWLIERLAEEPRDLDELRAVVMAREVDHEYSQLLGEIFEEYRVSFATIAGGSTGMAMRAKAIAFTKLVSTARISVDLKVEVFRNRNRRWSWNMLRDIDALSIAVPYCHLVVADRDATSLLRRTGADKRHETVVIASLEKLPDQLDLLSNSAVDTSTGWDELGPNDGEYHLDAPGPMMYDEKLAGAQLRLIDDLGRLVTRPVPTGS